MPTLFSRLPSTTTHTSKAADFEPNDKWKDRLKAEIQQWFQSLVQEAKENQFAELKKAITPEERKRLNIEYKAAVASFKQFADDRYQVKLEGERNKRRRLAGEPISASWSAYLKAEEEHIKQGGDHSSDRKKDLPPTSRQDREFLRSLTPRSPYCGGDKDYIPSNLSASRPAPRSPYNDIIPEVFAFPSSLRPYDEDRGYHTSPPAIPSSVSPRSPHSDRYNNSYPPPYPPHTNGLKGSFSDPEYGPPLFSHKNFLSHDDRDLRHRNRNQERGHNRGERNGERNRERDRKRNYAPYPGPRGSPSHAYAPPSHSESCCPPPSASTHQHGYASGRPDYVLYNVREPGPPSRATHNYRDRSSPHPELSPPLVEYRYLKPESMRPIPPGHWPSPPPTHEDSEKPLPAWRSWGRPPQDVTALGAAYDRAPSEGPHPRQQPSKPNSQRRYRSPPSEDFLHHMPDADPETNPDSDTEDEEEYYGDMDVSTHPSGEVAGGKRTAANGKDKRRRSNEESEMTVKVAKRKLRLQAQDTERLEEQERFPEEELRRKEREVLVKEEEVRKKVEEVAKKVEEVAKKAEEVQRKEEEVQKMAEEARLKEEAARIKVGDARKMQDGLRKKEYEAFASGRPHSFPPLLSSNRQPPYPYFSLSRNPSSSKGIVATSSAGNGTSSASDEDFKQRRNEDTAPPSGKESSPVVSVDTRSHLLELATTLTPPRPEQESIIQAQAENHPRTDTDVVNGESEKELLQHMSPFGSGESAAAGDAVTEPTAPEIWWPKANVRFIHAQSRDHRPTRQRHCGSKGINSSALSAFRLPMDSPAAPAAPTPAASMEWREKEQTEGPMVAVEDALIEDVLNKDTSNLSESLHVDSQLGAEDPYYHRFFFKF